jgi:hypothetical protein
MCAALKVQSGIELALVQATNNGIVSFQGAIWLAKCVAWTIAVFENVIQVEPAQYGRFYENKGVSRRYYNLFVISLRNKALRHRYSSADRIRSSNRRPSSDLQKQLLPCRWLGHHSFATTHQRLPAR